MQSFVCNVFVSHHGSSVELTRSLIVGDTYHITLIKIRIYDNVNFIFLINPIHSANIDFSQWLAAITICAFFTQFTE